MMNLKRAAAVPLLALLALLLTPQAASADPVGCSPVGKFQYSETYGAVQGFSGASCTHPSHLTVRVDSRMYRGGTYVASDSGTCHRGTYNGICDIGMRMAAYYGPTTWTLKIKLTYSDGSHTRTAYGEVSRYL